MTVFGPITPESASRFADLTPYRIHYYEAGEGHPIVLLHGSGPGATGWSNFKDNLGHLAETNRVLAVDMPGWGRSDTQNDADGRDHAANLVALLDHLGIEKAALVGNSMGGMTSIMTAIRFPERVSHLITMGAPCPGVDVSAPDGPSEGLKFLNAAYQDPTPETMKKLVQVMCFDEAIATDELAKLRSEAALARPDHLQDWGKTFPAMNARFQGFIGRIPEIGAPTLAVHGRDDRVVPFEASIRLIKQAADARLLLLARCGHWAMIEHPQEFNRAVRDFVANN